jgi:hypothetical protein
LQKCLYTFFTDGVLGSNPSTRTRKKSPLIGDFFVRVKKAKFLPFV